MSYFAILRVALKALNANKMRTILTMLGIIIGVGSVITMLSIGKGVSNQVESNINSLGTNVLTITPGNLSRGGVFQSGMEAQSLTPDDVKAIERECPSIAYVSPIVRRNMQVISGNQNWNTSVYGASESYGDIRNWGLSSGSFFASQDVQSTAKVCVVGSAIVENLFNGEDPINQILRIQKVPFRIIGVLEEKGQTGMGNQDDCVIVPYTTAMTRLNRMKNLNSIACSVVSEDQMKQGVQEITDLIRQRHRIPDGSDDDFTVRSQADLASAMAEVTGVMTLFLSAIAFVSLLVGGIGIMNIMLVSVTERIREIGIRMALGARGIDILMQFLSESIVLSVMGGIVGILLGMTLSWIIAHFAKWQAIVTIESVLLSFAFAASVGIFFGFYPAFRASQLDPIEALRHE